jgi:hypothetical protein
MADVSEFEVGGLTLALRADSPLGFKLASTQPYLDQISGLTYDRIRVKTPLLHSIEVYCSVPLTIS